MVPVRHGVRSAWLLDGWFRPPGDAVTGTLTAACLPPAAGPPEAGGPPVGPLCLPPDAPDRPEGVRLQGLPRVSSVGRADAEVSFDYSLFLLCLV